MFDFDAGKLIIIGIVALIVIGPKELPRVMRQVGQAAAKMRRMAADFRGQFMDAMREADIEDIKADVGRLAESAKIDRIDPLAEIKAGITSALEAADKPAALPLDSAARLAAPGDADASLNLIALPRLPQTPEEGAATFLAAGVAPVAGATDAEMRALADALAAEMGEAAPLRTGTDAAKTQDKV